MKFAMVGSVGTLAGAVGNRPITSVIALAELALIIWGIRMLFTGRIITGREADERDKRYAEKVAECTQLRETIASFSEAIETSNAMIRAIMTEATAHEPDGRERSSQDGRRGPR